MPDSPLVKGLLLGLLLLPALVLSVLSSRPGGLRNALRNVIRRLKLFLGLAAVYLVVSAVLKLTITNADLADVAMAVLALGLGVVFILRGQDQQLPG